MRKIQRRDFLKAMGLTTAALGLTACGGSLSLIHIFAQLLGVDVVHPLILAGVAAVGKALGHGLEAVSYTHLDVYKRQPHRRTTR